MFTRANVTLILALLGLTALLAGPASGQVKMHLDGARGGAVRETLSLEQGKSLVLDTSYDVQRVSVGNAAIADVVVLGERELNVVAKDVGDTNLVVWDSRGRPRAALDLSVGRPYAGIEAQMRRVLGTSDLHVDSAGDSIVLRGTVSSVEDLDRATRVAGAYFPDESVGGFINLLDVGGDQQVMIEVTIAEMSRRFTKEIESNFANLGKNPGDEFSVFSFMNNLARLDQANQSPLWSLTESVNLFGGYFDIGRTAYNIFLNYLQGEGLIKILAEPTLLARSGQTASFLAGGEIPIPIVQGGAFGSISIEYKEFGVRVGFTPTVLGEDRIHMEIAPEVSEPDFTIGTTVAGTAVPGFRTRRASTAVELADGQSFAIAGLLTDSVREGMQQYPVLGDIPVLGTLFRSKQYQRDETELVLLVRPRMAKPLAPGEAELPTDNFIQPSDFEFFLTNALEGKGPETRGYTARAPAGLLGASGHRVSIAEAEKELK